MNIVGTPLKQVMRSALMHASASFMLPVAEQLEIPVDAAELVADYRALPIRSKKELALNGGDLIREAGIAPGREMGRILDFLEEEVLSGRVANEHDALIVLAERKAE